MRLHEEAKTMSKENKNEWKSAVRFTRTPNAKRREKRDQVPRPPPPPPQPQI